MKYRPIAPVTAIERIWAAAPPPPVKRKGIEITGLVGGIGDAILMVDGGRLREARIIGFTSRGVVVDEFEMLPPRSQRLAGRAP